MAIRQQRRRQERPQNQGERQRLPAHQARPLLVVRGPPIGHQRGRRRGQEVEHVKAEHEQGRGGSQSREGIRVVGSGVPSDEGGVCDGHQGVDREGDKGGHGKVEDPPGRGGGASVFCRRGAIVIGFVFLYVYVHVHCSCSIGGFARVVSLLGSGQGHAARWRSRDEGRGRRHRHDVGKEIGRRWRPGADAEFRRGWTPRDGARKEECRRCRRQ
mmetsp:Transcript_15157/g.33086  ORF Transcript_15157/g.33086 Transcript_15157/m.33086 type:complete len:214 (-) Transcript_15157:177-818(-)